MSETTTCPKCNGIDIELFVPSFWVLDLPDELTQRLGNAKTSDLRNCAACGHKWHTSTMMQTPHYISETISMEDILLEVRKATGKFPVWPNDPIHAVSILMEEAGELTKAVNELCYEPEKAKPGEVCKEAIQTAAMAIRFCMSLSKYEFKPEVQHVQVPVEDFTRGHNG